MSYWNMEPVKYTGNRSELSFKPEYRYYNPEEVILGKTMEDWCRFSVAFWHTINQRLTDPFGDGTAYRPYDSYTDPMDQALAKMEAMFELCETLGVKYFTFHDRDIAPEGDSLRESNKNLDKVVDKILDLQKTSDVKVLWNTCNLFGNPRFLAGAATSPYADVFAYAAGQLKKSLEIGKLVGSENFVFWGGREGYETLLNTDLGREKEHMAKFMHMAVDYAKEIGFDAQFLIEPKPKEPTSHQYDFDTATAISFLKTFGLDDYFKMNIEGNHANLAAHSYQHELCEANAAGMLGSLDANQGDTLIGWDIDEFPSNLYEASMVMYEVIRNGSIGPKGGLNFDSKPRRTSYKPEDLFYTHIVGIDTFAAGLRVAAKLYEDKALENIVSERYKSFDTGIGAKIESGEADLKTLSDYVIDKTNEEIYAACDSDHSECTKDIINRYLINALK